MHRRVLALFAALWISAAVAAQEPDSTSRDYKNELPRVPPTKAAEFSCLKCRIAVLGAANAGGQRV